MAAISNSLVSMRNPPAQFTTGTLFSHISYFLILSVFFFFFWFFQILLYWLLNYVSYTMILLAFLESIDSGWKISFFDQLERFTSIPFSFLIIMFRVLSFDPNNKLIIFVGFFSPLYVWICQFSERARLMHDFLDGFAILES